MQYRNKWALITGASAGIGTEFAKQYAQLGCNVVLIARREERLQQLASELEQQFEIKTHVIVADLANPTSPQTIFDNTQQNNIHIDILVNNAGFGFKESFLDCDWQRIQDGLQVMLTSLIHLTYLYVSKMQQKKYGRVLNISSVGSFVSGYHDHNLYCGIKGQVNEFSKMISKKVSKDDVFVSAICPGFTRTEFHKAAGTEEMRTNVPNFIWMPANDVVRIAIKQNERNKTIVLTGWLNRIIALLLKVFN